jgi:hypothetical protein
MQLLPASLDFFTKNGDPFLQHSVLDRKTYSFIWHFCFLSCDRLLANDAIDSINFILQSLYPNFPFFEIVLESFVLAVILLVLIYVVLHSFLFFNKRDLVGFMLISKISNL